MYYECTQCGQIATYATEEGSQLRAPCPVCEEPTRWTLAFADEEGVSF